MGKQFNSNAEYLKAELRKGFYGAKLADVVIDEQDGESWLGLVFSRADGQQWVGWISCDPEGNAPGWLDLAFVNNGQQPSALQQFMAAEIGKEIGENFDIDELVAGAIADETETWLKSAQHDTAKEFIERFGQDAYAEAVGEAK